jgi:hypothetical protein
MLKTRIDTNEKRMDTNERMTGAKIIQKSKVNPPAGGQDYPRSRHPDESQDLTDSESSSE